MNIHIDKDKFLLLNQAPKVGTFEIGSTLYGLNDEHSDKDYLTIYYPFIDQVNNPFLNHHQYQYKDIENNVDYNFIDIVGFIRNLVSGDSTINFELIHSEQMLGTDLESLYYIRKEFYTYNIIKAYIGFAKRDVKALHTRKSEHDKNRGILHIERSYISAINTLVQDFKLNFRNQITSVEDVIKNYNYSEVLNRLDNFRKNLLNKALEEGKILRYLDPHFQYQINNGLRILITENPNNETINLFDIYKTNENPELKYESTS